MVKPAVAERRPRVPGQAATCVSDCQEITQAISPDQVVGSGVIIECMLKKTLTVECPCCGATLQIDAASGKILFAEEPKHSRKDFSFDGQLEQIRKQKEQADDMFSKAFREEAERKKLLERKFEEAQKKAQEDKSGAPPRRPFDWD